MYRLAVANLLEINKQSLPQFARHSAMAATNRKLLLKSVNDTHPNIEISSNEAFFLGRSPVSCIQDTLVSRKHINLLADFEKKCVLLKVLGVNASALNGNVLEGNKEYTAVDGDVLEVLPSKYLYKVCFVKDVDAEEKTSTPIKRDQSPSEKETKKKRKLSSGEERQTSSKRRKWTVDIFNDAKDPFPGDANWLSYNKGQLIVFTMAECRPSKKIAAYDMDGTLILTKSGRIFPKDADDWRIAFGPVVKTLKDKTDDGYKIVILTNQAGISKGKTKLVDLKKKIENIAVALKVPLQAFIATGDSCFRKPLTGMWQALARVGNDDVELKSELSFYVGDAAGRPENKVAKRKKDHSTVDRLLALNLGLTFYTPEEHFMKASPGKWVEPEFDPIKFLKSISKSQDLDRLKLNTKELEIVVMVGGPGSGKSFFANDILACNSYAVVNRDTLGSWQKCVDRVNDLIKAGKKVVVDNTNGTKEQRGRYVTAAKRHKVPCRCFVMATTHHHTLHNIAFRELTDASHSKISDIVINSYRKYYEVPELEEGFTEISSVEFVPKFENEKDQLLYGMYLS